MKTYYKVVRVVDGKFYSCSVYPGLEYRVGYWTEPKVGKLFVFNNLNAARSYFITCDYKIFECEVDSPTRLKYRLRIPIAFLDDDDIKYFWNNYSKMLRKNSRERINEGTVLVGKVKLVREVEL